MDENEIKNALKFSKNFGGCFAKDEIPPFIGKSQGIIINTDERSKPGTHWIAVYIDSKGRGELFDSLASYDVLKEFDSWLSSICSEYLFPAFPVQSSISKLCGVYAIAFLRLRFENQSFDEVMQVFRRNPVMNDLLLAELLKRYNNK